MALISIVTGTLNRLPHLQKMVQSVRDTLPRSIDYEIVAVDNGSNDGTWDWLIEQDDVRPLQMGKAVGAIKAVTEGAKIARGKYVVLGNDDIWFPDGALLKAVRHLEDNPQCGGVAFANDRKRPGKFEHWYAGARLEDGTETTALYTLTGMFRRELGERFGWWGADGALKDAWTYGGDNFLSAMCWENGYSIDAVEGVYNHDAKPDDEVRGYGKSRHSDDGKIYCDLFPECRHLIRHEPKFELETRRQLRIMWLPLYRPTNPWQREQDTGIGDGLRRYGLVYEYDYRLRRHEGANVKKELIEAAKAWQPHLIITNVHGTMQLREPYITTDELQALRNAAPKAVAINYYGDFWWDVIVNDNRNLAMFEVFDAHIVVNEALVPMLAAKGIQAFYLPQSFQPVTISRKDAPEHDLIFTGNGYTQYRNDLAALVAEMGGALYGTFKGVGSLGSTLGNRQLTMSMYANAKVAISPMQFKANANGFVSNRFWEILASGGAICLQQHAPGLDELTGLEAGKHYIEWTDFDDLREKIAYWLDPENDKKRKRIVNRARREVRKNHTWDARIDQFFSDILPNVTVKRSGRVELAYIGKRTTPFGERGRRRQYIYEPGVPFLVEPADAEYLTSQFPDRWQRVNAMEAGQ